MLLCIILGCYNVLCCNLFDSFMKKKILILGATGMAGHLVYLYLQEKNRFDIINVSYRSKLTDDSLILDIKNTKLVEELIQIRKPDYIVNCIGVLIKGSLDVENAVFVNAYFPHLLMKLADEVGAKLIHISTDCVFSGKTGRYADNAFRDADDIYGRSKALGEIGGFRHLTIRTSIIGPEIKQNGEGLFHWFMKQTGVVNGYTNAIWGGVTTLELAKFVLYCIENENIFGLVQLTNEIQISKYELLVLIKKIWNTDLIEIIKGEGAKTVDKSLLKSEKLDFNISTYEGMLKDLFSWMNTHKKFYTQYPYPR